MRPPPPSRKRNRSLVDLALGFTTDIMPLGPMLAVGGMPPWSISIPAEPEPVVAPVTSPPAVARAIAAPKLRVRSQRPIPAAEDASDRDAALLAWRVIIRSCGTAFGIANDFAKGTIPDVEDLSPYFAQKRTGTLALHACAWRLFLRFADQEGLDPSAVDEQMAYAYLKQMAKDTAPASRSAAFLKACNFAFGTCRFLNGPLIAQSARCIGAAAVALASKRTRLQRDTLKLDWVRALELEVVLAAEGKGALTQQEGAVGGFILFCIHGRARCADAAKVLEEPTLDEAEDEDPLASFVEAVTTGANVKTGNTPNKSRLQMPIVALSKGVSDLPWGRAWLVLRQAFGHSAELDGCLQREPLSDGSFGYGRLRAGQATEWMRHILCKLMVLPSALVNVGSHSCKATLLSVAAKAGLPRDVRRVLGGHALPGDASVDVYSRDSLAAPLLDLAKVLSHIRAGDFDPDSSRSGRWRRASAEVFAAVPADCACCEAPLAVGRIFKCECQSWIHAAPACSQSCVVCGADICVHCVLFDAHSCVQEPIAVADADEDDLSSEDDSDGENAMMAVAEAEGLLMHDEAKVAFLEKGIATGSDASFPEGGLLVNKITEVAHKLRGPNCTACGLKASSQSFEYFYEESALSGLKLCWRAGCAPWCKR